MSDYLLFAALGLGSGAVFAMLGVGIVLEYRSANVINFAHGAMAMFVAYVFTELRDTGDLVFPLVGIPDRLHLDGGGMAFVPALVLSLVYAALLGMVTYALIFRALRQSNPLTRIVASVGLMLALQALAVLKFGTQPRSVAAILPAESFEFLGVRLSSEQLYLAAIAIVATVVFWAVYRFTKFGISTRAAAENEKGAVLVGISPHRVALLNWMLAALLAGLAGILILPISALDPVIYTLFIVPALGAALVGRFTSFGVTTVAAFGMGILISLISQLQIDFTWLPRTGLKEGVPFLVILLAMTVAGARIPARGSLRDVLPPRAARPEHPYQTAAVLVPVAIGVMYVLDSTYRGGLIRSLVTAVLCLSLVVLAGYGGQISLAQAALAGISGFVLSKLALDLGIPFPLSPLLAAMAAVPLGLIIGLPALRVRGVNLAVVTLGAAVAIDALVLRNESVSGGLEGSEVPPPELFGLDLGIRSGSNSTRPIFGVLVIVVLAGLMLAIANLRRSATGRRILAVRANEQSAAAAGINVANTKLYVFALSAFIAGVGGTLIGYENTLITPLSYGIFVSITILAITYIGGICNLSGALFAGLLLTTGGIGPLFFEKLLEFQRFEVLVSGVGLILVTTKNPAGIASDAMRGAQSLGRALARRVGLTVPSRSSESEPIPSDHAPEAPAPTLVSSGSLRVEHLSVNFGGVRALHDVSIAVAPGSITGLIGPNGAGKTTFVDAVTGFVTAEGAVWFDDARIDQLRPDTRSRRGLTRTFQSIELFEDLTVGENLLAAVERPQWWTMGSHLLWPGHDNRVLAEVALATVGLPPSVADALPTELSHGQRKLVGVARAIADPPRLLILDEPAAGLDTDESQAFGEHLRRIARSGTTILLVDHDMSLVFEVCDDIWVLDFGEVIAHGAPAAIRADRTVIGAYLGSSS